MKRIRWISALLLCAALRGDDAPLQALAQGAQAMEEKRFADAVGLLDRARRGVPALADYAAYLGAAARFELGDYAAVEANLQPLWNRTPRSPLTGKAAVLLGNALLQLNRPAAAAEVVKEHARAMKPPEAESLLAHAAEAQGQRSAALAHYRRILSEYPLSAEAADAGSDPARLATLPDAARLTRCRRLLEGGQAEQARRELEAWLPGLAGSLKDSALIQLAAAHTMLRDHAGAAELLRSFSAASPETEAERLYSLLRCARRLDQSAVFPEILDKLARDHARSPFRLQALVAGGDFSWLRNDATAYQPIYRTCAEAFPGEGKAAECLWRLSFSEYLRRRPDAETLLRSYLQRYPEAEKALTARYFLARLAEARGDGSVAASEYREIVHRSPNSFYGVLAREHSKSAAPPGGTPVDLSPNSLSLARRERARLLASAGLPDLAESELRFGARTDGQPEVAALELAELDTQRGAPDLAIRAIKQLAPHYLRLPLDASTQRFWKLAFPLPFRESLERFSRELGLDPFLVAALIRQESEFNPRAVSRAKAYGLMQVLPSTGREISRKLNLARFQADLLFQPEISLRVGSFFFRSLLDRAQGRWEAALASYNAGPGRVAKWLTWAEYREPAEFIESIPFDETRNYVQSVYRNADLYRRLYGGAPEAKRP